MQLVQKVLDFKVDQVDEQARTFWAVASTGQVDRQGDLMVASGWDLANFVANPVIPWAHDYSAPPVAQALQIKVEGDRLLFQAQFARPEEYAFADTIFRLYQGGYLRAFSVGFVPMESEVFTSVVGGRACTGIRYLKQELYEISCVTLPANPQALVGLSFQHPNPVPLWEGHSPLPANRPQNAFAANPALVQAGLKCLVNRRLRYHLGL